MVQVPMPMRVTCTPEIVQTEVVFELKLTSKPEEAVAASVNGAVPNARLLKAPNVIVWLPLVTWKLWLTGAAAA